MKLFVWDSRFCLLFSAFVLMQSCMSVVHADPGRRKKKSDESEKKGKLEQFKGDDDDEEDEDEGTGHFWKELLFDAGWEFTKFLLFSPSIDSTRFISYPYAQGESGLSVRDASLVYRTGFGQVQVAYHYIDDNIYGILFNFRGRLNDIAGLNLNITRYREDLMKEPDDNMIMVRLGLMKSLLIKERLIWDLDLGIRSLENNAGFDAGMRCQMFPKPPFSMDLWASAGSMNQSLFLEFKPMIGILTGRFQWDLGFRYLRWEDEDLHGVLCGMRIWF
ncbi:hypothetical protein JW835_13105 [bacterium]|nr:hypothetical protein [bacterium]